ncbi:MAG: hypothetical protein HRS57_03030 [Mycoplasmataceae bacterium]|nr:hypothetical protein [Mycoplasmataceae bacterium]
MKTNIDLIMEEMYLNLNELEKCKVCKEYFNNEYKKIYDIVTSNIEYVENRDYFRPETKERKLIRDILPSYKEKMEDAKFYIGDSSCQEHKDLLEKQRELKASLNIKKDNLDVF